MAKKEIVDKLNDLAYQTRVKLIELSGSYGGTVHIGGDLSTTDVLTALYHYGMNVDPKNITMPNRDRFILSKGHAAVCMYIVMALRGFYDMDRIFSTYAQLDSAYGMHPCRVQLPELETSTGSLGHGLPIATGMALKAKRENQPYRVFCLMGDGETCEGTVWEAANVASSYNLGNMIGIIDRNKQFMTFHSEEGYIKMEPFGDRWRAFGWNVVEVDGHNMNEIVDAIDALPGVQSDKPTALICNTIKGKGISFMERVLSYHAAALPKDKVEVCLKELEKTYKGAANG